MAARRNRSSEVSSVFYGRKGGDESDASMESMLSDDDSVDDPDFIISKEKNIGGDDSCDDSEGEGERGDDNDNRGSIISDISGGAGDTPIAGPSGVGVGETPRVRQQGKEMVKVGRVLVRGEWANEKEQRLRNQGKEYESYRTGKMVAAKKIGQPCKDGCFNNVGEEAIKDIFYNFWASGNYNMQNEYLSQ